MRARPLMPVVAIVMLLLICSLGLINNYSNPVESGVQSKEQDILFEQLTPEQQIVLQNANSNHVNARDASSPMAFEWAASGGGTYSGDFIEGIAIDASGNAFVAGCFGTTAQFGPTILTAVGGCDIFVAKLDGDGNWLWAVRAGGAEYDYAAGIAVDGAGNAYVTGSFLASSVDFGPYTLASAGGTDVFVAKINSDGNWLWAERAGGTWADYGGGITVDTAGVAYLTGSFYSSAEIGNTSLSSSGHDDIFVAKIDASGNWLWAVRGGGSEAGDYGENIGLDSASNAYVIGTIEGSGADFGSTTLNSAGGTDVLIAKLDSDGNWQWAERAGGAGWDSGHGIAVDWNGNIHVTGSFYGASAEFGSTILSTAGEDDDAFIGRLDSSGTWMWVKQAGGFYMDGGHKIAIDSSGNSFVTGKFQGIDANFGSTLLTSSGPNEMFVAGLDVNGNWLWAKSGGGEGSDYGNAIAVDADGNVYPAGNFDGVSAGFGHHNLSTSGGGDPFVAKMSTDDDDDGVPNTNDECANTADDEIVDAAGCSWEQLDDDDDEVLNIEDSCSGTNIGETVDENGCSSNQRDDDSDGLLGADDNCSDTGAGESVDTSGCSTNQRDDDGDGLLGAIDDCPSTTSGEEVNETGCSSNQRDDDLDGILGLNDDCPQTSLGESVIETGCSWNQRDADGDGVLNEVDACTESSGDLCFAGALSGSLVAILLWFLLPVTLLSGGFLIYRKLRGADAEEALDLTLDQGPSAPPGSSLPSPSLQATAIADGYEWLDHDGDKWYRLENSEEPWKKWQ